MCVSFSPSWTKDPDPLVLRLSLVPGRGRACEGDAQGPRQKSGLRTWVGEGGGGQRAAFLRPWSLA